MTKTAKPDTELAALLRRTAGHKMTRAERDEQRVSWVYGNLPEESTQTEGEVRARLVASGLIAMESG